jgi:hypothetical protein
MDRKRSRERERDENRNKEPNDAKRPKRNERKLRQLTIPEMFAKQVSAFYYFEMSVGPQCHSDFIRSTLQAMSKRRLCSLPIS